MSWLLRSIVMLGMVGGLAMVAGGCEYDDHHHYHDRYDDRRPVGYRYDPYHHGHWRGDHDWGRRYDRDWDHHRGWHHDRW